MKGYAEIYICCTYIPLHVHMCLSQLCYKAHLWTDLQAPVPNGDYWEMIAAHLCVVVQKVINCQNEL